MSFVQKSILSGLLAVTLLAQTGCIVGASTPRRFGSNELATSYGVGGAIIGFLAGGFAGAGVGFVIGDVPASEMPALRVQSHDPEAQKSMGFQSDAQVDLYNESLPKLVRFHEEVYATWQDLRKNPGATPQEIPGVKSFMDQAGYNSTQTMIDEFNGDKLSPERISNISAAREIDPEVLKIFLHQTYGINL